ncbi:MAG TPA: hypothetical protein VGS80_26155 [Ktedonobacterales bacterium]|jgi:hypothetical protein|nr:hypothetical protein [Ktedonobacterales bacterium]
MSAVIGAVRGLLLNQPDAATISQALAWRGGLLVMFIGLSALVYGRRTAR